MSLVESNDRMATITYVELALIIGVGVYQFFTIRNFLVQKQFL